MDFTLQFVTLSYFVRLGLCIEVYSCHGNYISVVCNNKGLVAIQELQYGAKNFHNSTCPENDADKHGVCCEYTSGDCLQNMTNFNDKYIYYSRTSGKSSISDNTETSWTKLDRDCGSRSYSNYVRMVYDCVNATDIAYMCQSERKTGTTFYLMDRDEDGSDICECSIHRQDNASQTVRILAIDVRLQDNVNVAETNYTGECINNTNEIRFADKKENKTIHCENGTIIGGYSTLFTSSDNVVNITLANGINRPQKVWLYVDAGSSNVSVRCGDTTRVPTYITDTHLTVNVTPHKTTTPKTRNNAGKHPKQTDMNVNKSNRQRQRATENAVLYSILILAAFTSIIIILVGVFINRQRRRKKKPSPYKKMHTNDIYTLQSIPRERPTFYTDSTDDPLAK